MHFDTDGIYTLQYTATDSCGNETIEERTVEVVSLRTVLYTDGTFIINEKSTDQATNEALHGVATDVYNPLDNNTSYNFRTANLRPWHSKRASVKAVEIGSKITPQATTFWFEEFTACESMNLDGLDTSAVTNMGNMFRKCSVLTALDLSKFDTSNVLNMANMFQSCAALEKLDVSSFNTSKVTNMAAMFNGCQALTSLYLTNFDTSAVTDMSSMFRNCIALTVLDISSFDNSVVTSPLQMFSLCTQLTTIYASATFDFSDEPSVSSGFSDCSTNLVGGAGTVWSSDKTSIIYACIDNPPTTPGYFTAKA